MSVPVGLTGEWNALLIAQLVAQLGPVAFNLIDELIEVWNKPALTVEEVKGIVQRTRAEHAAYIAGVKARAAAAAAAAEAGNL